MITVDKDFLLELVNAINWLIDECEINDLFGKSICEKLALNDAKTHITILENLLEVDK